MKTLALSAASQPLAQYAADLDDEVLVLTEGSRPIAAIVPLRNVDKESLALSNHPGFLALIEQSRREIARGETIWFGEMEAAVRADKAPQSGRRESRTKRSTRPRPQGGSGEQDTTRRGRGL